MRQNVCESSDRSCRERAEFLVASGRGVLAGARGVSLGVGSYRSQGTLRDSKVSPCFPSYVRETV